MTDADQAQENANTDTVEEDAIVQPITGDLVDNDDDDRSAIAMTSIISEENNTETDTKIEIQPQTQTLRIAGEQKSSDVIETTHKQEDKDTVREKDDDKLKDTTVKSSLQQKANIHAGHESNEEELQQSNLLTTTARSLQLSTTQRREQLLELEAQLGEADDYGDNDDDEEEEEAKNEMLFDWSSILYLEDIDSTIFIDLVIPPVIRSWNQHSSSSAATANQKIEISALQELLRHERIDGGNFQSIDVFADIFKPMGIHKSSFFQIQKFVDAFIGKKLAQNQDITRFLYGTVTNVIQTWNAKDIYFVDIAQLQQRLRERKIDKPRFAEMSAQAFFELLQESTDADIGTGGGGALSTTMTGASATSMPYWYANILQHRIKSAQQLTSEVAHKRNMCWMKCEIKYLSIDENFETAIATCKLKLEITIYWLPQESNSKTWRPSITISNAIQTETSDVGEVQTVPVKQFFKNQNAIRSIVMPLASTKNVYSQAVEYDIEIEEPFELKAFPFDYQDLPIRLTLDNIDRLAPLMNHPFVTTTGNVTSLGTWDIEALFVEFHKGDQVWILLKMARNWTPICVSLGLLLGAISLLSLTSFFVEDDNIADKIGTVLGLVLALIFVDIPKIPIVTFVDTYFYVCFAYVVAVAFVNALSINEFVLSAKWTFLAVFASLYFVFQGVFFVSAVFTLRAEQRKSEMNSTQIQTLNEKGMMKIDATDSGEYIFGSALDSLSLYSGEAVFFHAKAKLATAQSSQFDEPGNNDWAPISAMEWSLQCIALLLQFPIGMSQLVMNENEDCSANQVTHITNEEIIVYMLFSCAALVIVMFLFIAVGITPRLVRSLFVFVTVLMCANFVIGVHSIAFWVNIDRQCKDSHVTLRISQLSLLIISAVLFAVVLAYKLMAIFVNGRKLLYVFVSLWHFMILLAGVYQWCITYALSADHCLQNSGYASGVSVAESLVLIVAQLLTMLLWLLYRVLSAELESLMRQLCPCFVCCRYNFHFVYCTIGFGTLLTLLQLGFAVRSLLFWSEDISCISRVQQTLMQIFLAVSIPIPLIFVVVAIIVIRMYWRLRLELAEEAEKEAAKRERERGTKKTNKSGAFKT